MKSTRPDVPKQEAENEGSRFRWRAPWALVLALPALWTGFLIFHYGVDVPYLDHWYSLCPLLEKMEAGTLRLADFFAFVGPHREFFPRLIMFGLAKLTHWNVRAEYLTTWIFACVCALNLWRLASITGLHKGRMGFGLFFAAYVLLFTPLKIAIWLRGVEMQYTLTVACMTACLWIAPSARFPANYLLTMVLSIVCTYSLTNGFICWLVTFPLLLLSRDHAGRHARMGWGLFWLLGFLFSVWLYFRGSHFSLDSSLAQLFQHPIQALQFFLVYLGGGFRRGTAFRPESIAQIVGVMLLFAFGVVAGYLWRWRCDTNLRARTLPWLMLAGFALLNNVLTTIARLDLGLSQALSSRYISFAILLPMGLLFLTPPIFQHWRARKSEEQKTALVEGVIVCLVASLTLLHVLSSVNRLDAWRHERHDRLAGKAMLLLCNVVNDGDSLLRANNMAAASIRHDASLIVERVNFLDRVGYFRPRLLRTDVLHNIIGVTTLDPRRFGEIQKVGSPQDQRIGMSGWSVLPHKERRADAVLLTRDDPQRGPIIFAVALVENYRMDLTDLARHPKHLRESGWLKTFDLSLLPPGNNVVRAWAFDAEDCRAYPIYGRANIVVDNT